MGKAAANHHIEKAAVGISLALSLILGIAWSGWGTVQKAMAADLKVATTLTVQASDSQNALTTQAASRTRQVTLYVDSATQRTTVLTAKGLKASKAKWKSSDAKVAKVNKHGKVTAKKVGNAVITAKQGKKTFKFEITVKNVWVDNTKLTIGALAAEGRVSLVGDKIKSVKSSNPKVAQAEVVEYGENGRFNDCIIHGLKPGIATVTIVSKKGLVFKCKSKVRKSTRQERMDNCHHDWEPVYQLQTSPYIQCLGCGAEFDSVEEHLAHVYAFHEAGDDSHTKCNVGESFTWTLIYCKCSKCGYIS